MRVSTDEQAERGAGLEAQEAQIRAEASRRSWDVVAVFRDAGVSGRRLDGRPGLSEALSAIESGPAEALVIAKLDRLSRSLIDAATLIERSRRDGWAIVALDLGVDTTTTSGGLVANVMAAVAEWERRVIGERTREALAAGRDEGVRLGRPRVIPPYVREAIVSARRRGLTYRAIAAQLNRDGVSTAHGGRRWHAATIRKVVKGGP